MAHFSTCLSHFYSHMTALHALWTPMRGLIQISSSTYIMFSIFRNLQDSWLDIILSFQHHHGESTGSQAEPVSEQITVRPCPDKRCRCRSSFPQLFCCMLDSSNCFTSDISPCQESEFGFWTLFLSPSSG